MREREQPGRIFFILSISDMSKNTHPLGVRQVPRFTREEMRPREINNVFEDTHDPLTHGTTKDYSHLDVPTSEGLGAF